MHVNAFRFHEGRAPWVDRYRRRERILSGSGSSSFVRTTSPPGPDDVLVKVESCGLCAWELNHWKGNLGTFPQTLGHEWGGSVVARGDNVAGLKVGDRVTGTTRQARGLRRIRCPEGVPLLHHTSGHSPRLCHRRAAEVRGDRRAGRRSRGRRQRGRLRLRIDGTVLHPGLARVVPPQPRGGGRR